MSKKQHKNQFYKRELNKFTQELEVLLKDPVIRKQYDTDIETKEHFSIHKRDGSYRFSCIQL